MKIKLILILSAKFDSVNDRNINIVLWKFY